MHAAGAMSCAVLDRIVDARDHLALRRHGRAVGRALQEQRKHLAPELPREGSRRQREGLCRCEALALLDLGLERCEPPLPLLELAALVRREADGGAVLHDQPSVGLLLLLHRGGAGRAVVIDTLQRRLDHGEDVRCLVRAEVVAGQSHSFHHFRERAGRVAGPRSLLALDTRLHSLQPPHDLGRRRGGLGACRRRWHRDRLRRRRRTGGLGRRLGLGRRWVRHRRHSCALTSTACCAPCRYRLLGLPVNVVSDRRQWFRPRRVLLHHGARALAYATATAP